MIVDPKMLCFDFLWTMCELELITETQRYGAVQLLRYW